MMKRIAISTALAGGLFAGVLVCAGAAQASYDYDAPYHGSARQYDAPYYGGPVPGRYDYDVRCQVPANSITIGPGGVSYGLPGGGSIAAGSGGVGYIFGC